MPGVLSGISAGTANPQDVEFPLWLNEVDMMHEKVSSYILYIPYIFYSIYVFYIGASLRHISVQFSLYVLLLFHC